MLVILIDGSDVMLGRIIIASRHYGLGLLFGQDSTTFYGWTFPPTKSSMIVS